MGVSEPTFYRWKKQFVGLGVPEIRRLKQLEDENAKLKRLVADLSLDQTMLQDVLRRKWWGPPFGARSLASERRACQATGSIGRPSGIGSAATPRRSCGCVWRDDLDERPYCLIEECSRADRLLPHVNVPEITAGDAVRGEAPACVTRVADHDAVAPQPANPPISFDALAHRHESQPALTVRQEGCCRVRSRPKNGSRDRDGDA